MGFLAIHDWTSVSLVSSPTAGWLDPTAAVIASNSLCTHGGASDKICTSGFVDIITSGGDYVWQFNVTGGTILPEIDWHIGAQFADAAGSANGQLISAAIPEPGAAVVFAIGALLIGFARGRRGSRT